MANRIFKEKNMTDCCVRELTFEEEIKALDIDEDTKKRIIAKATRILDENHMQGNLLSNCHDEIDKLERAIIEQSKVIATYAEQLDNAKKGYNF